ncbi:phosphoribosylamine-glycine ligase [Halomicroarcula sp. F24A]|uniref:Phosphoribosylamine-glycine ligase n=1 Tax=Haloarcula salinisoli TaxID=2487746 RepID=A0A8J7YLV5_9EURY|nr:phosphoribosylamine-glycine ligase [Halomicroarcula salinisoli]
MAVQEDGFDSPTGQFLDDLAHGRDPRLRVHLGFQVGVRAVLPPFPFDDEKTYDENLRNATVVFQTADRDGIHLEDAKCLSDGGPCDPSMVEGQWCVAGENGIPLVVTGKAETIQAARRQCYDRIDDIVVPNGYYRDDIGERWIAGNGDRVQAWGYLMSSA